MAAYIHTYIHTYKHTYMHTYIHTHTHTRTHTHTHTHIYITYDSFSEPERKVVVTAPLFKAVHCCNLNRQTDVTMQEMPVNIQAVDTATVSTQNTFSPWRCPLNITAVNGSKLQ